MDCAYGLCTDLVEENWTYDSSGAAIGVPTPYIFGNTVSKNC